MVVDPEKIYVEYFVNAINESDIIDWAVDALSDSFADDPPVLEIASLNSSIRNEYERAPFLLTDLVKRRGFIINSVRGIAYAKEALRRVCERYLHNEARPYDVCKMVTPIEHFFDYHDWLGNLFNACDWIEPDTKKEEVTGLEDEVISVLQGLNE